MTTNDLISRQSALDLVGDVCDSILSLCGSHYDEEVEDEVFDDIREVDAILRCNKEIHLALRDMPSAQPEIIHCQDCKYRGITNYCIYKTRLAWITGKNDFCNKAERREE